MNNTTQVDIIRYLTILELPTNEEVGIDVIKRQYRRLSKIYHPDVSKEDIYKNGEKFKSLNEAYEYISSNINLVNNIIKILSHGNIYSNNFKQEYDRQEQARREGERRERERQEQSKRQRENERQEQARREKERQERERQEREKQEARIKEEEKIRIKNQIRQEKIQKLKSIIDAIIVKKLKYIIPVFILLIFVIIGINIEKSLRRNVLVYDNYHQIYYSQKTYKGKTLKDAPEIEVSNGYYIEWYDNIDFSGNPLSFPITITKDLKMYPKIIPHKYYIYFETNGGEDIQPIYDSYRIEIKDDIIPIKEGYTFGGWYSDIDFTNKYEPTSIPLNGVTLYAKWIKEQYVISFETYNGPKINNIIKFYDEEIIEPTILDFEGYIFGGWYTEDNFINKFTFARMPSKNVTLYAKWIPMEYSIHFVTNNGDEDIYLLETYNKPIEYPDLQKEGFTFEGWYKDSNYLIKNDLITVPLDGITLYAKWKINRYTISFDSNGGTPVNSITQDFLSNISSLEAPQKEGFTFEGWYIDENIHFDLDYMPSSDNILYAKWKINQYTITFETNGGSQIDNIINDYMSQVIIPVPVKEGFSFDGWYKDETYVEKCILTTMPLNGIKLYSKWIINHYSINFETNSNIIIEPVTEFYMSSILIPDELVREGYTFDGWYSDHLFENKFNSNTMPSYNLTIFAKWNPLIYTITFESNQGSIVEPIIAEFESIVNEPEMPVREGYDFGGWYINKDCTDVFKFTNMPLNGAKLYAKWEYLIYNIDDFYKIDGVSSAHFILMNDIDFFNLTTENFGTLNCTFNGNGFKILNSKVNIFEIISTFGKLVNTTFISNFAPIYNNYGLIYNCKISNTDNYNFNSSYGLVYTNYGTIDSCINNASISRVKSNLNNIADPKLCGIAFINETTGLIINSINNGYFSAIDAVYYKPTINLFASGISLTNKGIIENCVNNGGFKVFNNNYQEVKDYVYSHNISLYNTGTIR